MDEWSGMERNGEEVNGSDGTDGTGVIDGRTEWKVLYDGEEGNESDETVGTGVIDGRTEWNVLYDGEEGNDQVMKRLERE
jgi:hypothetical protein